MSGRRARRSPSSSSRARTTTSDAAWALGALGADAVARLARGRELPDGVGAVVLPGGFSYGDYLRCGAIARFSPVMAAVREFAADGGPVLGICNGFQILCEAGLLPGRAAAERVALVRLPRRRGARRARRAAVHSRCERGPAARDPRQARRGLLVRAARARRRARGERPDRPPLRDGENPNGAVADVAGVVNERGQRDGADAASRARGRPAARLRRRGADPRLARRRGARSRCRSPSRRHPAARAPPPARGACASSARSCSRSRARSVTGPASAPSPPVRVGEAHEPLAARRSSSCDDGREPPARRPAAGR